MPDGSPVSRAKQAELRRGAELLSDPAAEAARRAWVAERIPTTFTRMAEHAAREALKPIRELHAPARFVHVDTGPFCPECDTEWPCATARLIYSTEELAT